MKKKHFESGRIDYSTAIYERTQHANRWTELYSWSTNLHYL